MYNSQTNLKLPKKMPKADVWYNLQYCDEKKELVTPDLKFSNNIGTMDLRPHSRDSVIDNLYHGNGYTRTELNIYNMGGAAEAGVNAGKAINSLKF
jgi:hypothetical protein